MELVYLWVEEYKNIKNQGFNFSPRFTCKYEKGKELIIDENKDCLENFFGKNINITAIVGENGSGKSTILQSIMSKPRIFMVVFDKKLKVYSKNHFVNTLLEQKHLQRSFFRDVLYYSMDDNYLKKMNPSMKYIELEETNKLITENYRRLNSLDFKIFNFKPAYILYELNNFKLIDEDYDIDDVNISSIISALGWNHNSDSSIIIETLKALKNIDDEYINYLLYQFGDINFLFENIDLTEKLHPKDFYLILRKDEIKDVLKECELSFLSESEFKSLIDNQSIKIEIGQLETLFGKNYLELLFMRTQDDIEFNYFSLNGASFNSLSHGEKTIYSFLVNLVNYNQKEFLFFLDEPDNTLHPDWQKKFLNQLIEIINILDKKAHIIITTHSPFLLSDIPKENVVFLEKDEVTGNCKNVTDKTNIKTFGANIHTLLSHGFFMKDGLMGEFAKGKIEDVINYLNDKESTIKDNYEAQKLLNIIGEPIIKNQLQRMLDSKRLSKVDEIDKIKSDMENLAKRLEELEK